MRRRHNYHVYILSNRHRTVLYTGVTGNLADRMRDAIAREKQIKAGSRQAKLNLIERDNPDWRDLADDLGEYL